MASEEAQQLFGKGLQKVKSGYSAAEAEAFESLLSTLGIFTLRRNSTSPVLQNSNEQNHSAIAHTTQLQSPDKSLLNIHQQAVIDDPVKKTCKHFRFTGSGREYFRIWIVNLVLVIITLGLYSPWAKVRNRRYFYGNTLLDDASFEYTADPKRMLIGRLISLALFALYYWLNIVNPTAGSAISLLFIFITPWSLRQSLTFHARNSVYRNVRFRSTYWQAFVVIILWPLAAVFSMGLLVPVMLQRWHRYIINNYSFGDKSFSFAAGPDRFYIVCIIFSTLFISGVLLGTLISFIQLSFVIPILLALPYTLALIYFKTAINNLIYYHTSIASHSFESHFELPGYGRIMFENFILIVFTLGLYWPVAKVRLAQYAAKHVNLQVNGSLDNFVSISQQDQSAFGEEFADVFDLGLDF
ncbi:MAG: YjgN family protein [Parahaliea sp.]